MGKDHVSSQKRKHQVRAGVESTQQGLVVVIRGQPLVAITVLENLGARLVEGKLL